MLSFMTMTNKCRAAIKQSTERREKWNKYLLLFIFIIISNTLQSASRHRQFHDVIQQISVGTVPAFLMPNMRRISSKKNKQK